MDGHRVKDRLRQITGRSRKDKSSDRYGNTAFMSPDGSHSPKSSGLSPHARSSDDVVRPPPITRLKSVKSPSFAQLVSRRSVQAQNLPQVPPQEQASSDHRQEEDHHQEESQPPETGNAPKSEPDEAEVDDLQFEAPFPKSRSSTTTVEGLAQLLVSEEHLNYIIQEPLLFSRFIRFLGQFNKHLVPVVLYHLECQKATKALEFANAVAGNLGPVPGSETSKGLSGAAAMNSELNERHRQVIDILTNEALPASITYGLVQVVSDTMSRSIQGRHQLPVMRNLIQGMTEVFCLTDPSLEDNPIIFASEEFYRMTGYGRDFVIGRNCRFLQGSETNKSSIKRLKDCVEDGVEISELLLNYRRDGTPFMNLLMVAPLHDNRGNVKYNIGAQVDVTGLVEGGQGLDGFDSFLVLKDRKDHSQHSRIEKQGKDLALEKLGELSEMFDASEAAIVRSNSRSNSMTRDSGYSSNYQREKGNNRRILIEDSDEDEDEDENPVDQTKEELESNSNWKLAPPTASTGKLPGVYQKYLLIRPAPSMRVIFISPGLRDLGASLRKPFFDCISTSKGTMHGLKDAFNSGAPVTAKVTWVMPEDDTSPGRSKKPKSPPRWISATPLLGSDDQIGVWMIVVVDGQSGQHVSRETSTRPNARESVPPRDYERSPTVPADEVTSNPDMTTTSQPQESDVSSPKAALGVQQDQSFEHKSATHNAKRSQADDTTPSNRDSKDFEATPSNRDSKNFEATPQQTKTEEPKPETEESKTETAAEDGPSASIMELQTLSAQQPQQQSQQQQENEIDASARQVPQEEAKGEDDGGGGNNGGGIRSDISSETDDRQEHLPVSKKIWERPPRPSLPSRMISID